MFNEFKIKCIRKGTILVCTKIPKIAFTNHINKLNNMKPSISFKLGYNSIYINGYLFKFINPNSECIRGYKTEIIYIYPELKLDAQSKNVLEATLTNSTRIKKCRYFSHKNDTIFDNDSYLLSDMDTIHKINEIDTKSNNYKMHKRMIIHSCFSNIKFKAKVKLTNFFNFD